MARGKKTGGRNFRRGNRGRPRGSRDKVPRTFKASVRRLCEEVAGNEALVRTALLRGLKAAPPYSFSYVQLLAYYVDGKPIETIRVQPDLSKYTPDELVLLEQLMAKGQS